MGILEDLLMRAAPGGFPAIPVPPIDPVEEATAAQAAREAAALRARKGVFRTTPLPEGSLLPFGALGAGMPPPTADVPAPVADLPAASPIDSPVPLPRERPKEADGTPAGDIATDPAALPPNAAPTSGIQPAPQQSIAPPAPPAAPVAAPEPSIFGRLMSGLKDNSTTLLALGAGFAGAPNIGQGISRAASAAIPASQADIKNRLLLQNQRETLNALIAAKVPPSMAMAALTNPEIMKAVSARYLETKPYVPHKIGTDAMGNDIMGSFNPNNNKYYDAAGREIGSGGSSAGGVSIPDAGAGMFAKGVTELNQDLPAEEYKAQFSPQVQAQMDAYIRGDTMPTGNPRLKGSATKIKEWATLYGSKAGIPVSDATFSERQTHRKEMASGKAGVGLQRTALRQGLEHLEGATKQAIDLGNYGLGLAPLTEGVNAIRGLTDAQKGKVTAFDNKIQTLAGEVGKFFSSAQGGGVHERQLTRDRFKGITAPTVLADAIDSTLELMEGGLHAREQSQQQLFGGKVDPNVQYLTQADRDRISHIRELSKQLREGKSAAPATLPAGKTSSGVSWSIVQ